MIQSHADALQQFSQTLKKTKVIAISDIANYTGESIDIQSLIAKLKLYLASNSKFIFSSAVGGSGAHIDTMITKSRKLRQNEEFNPYTTKEKGELLAPDYSLTGKITKNGAGYEFLLTLNDLSKGVEVWSNIARFQSIPKIEVQTITISAQEANFIVCNEILGDRSSICNEFAWLQTTFEKRGKQWADVVEKCIKTKDDSTCKEAKEFSKDFTRLFEILKQYPPLAQKLGEPYASMYQCEKDEGCISAVSGSYALANQDKKAMAFAKKSKNFNKVIYEIAIDILKPMGKINRAASYLKLICNGTDGGCAILADMYVEQKDYFNAIKYYTPLCQKANGELKGYACQKLGYFSTEGLGMRQDFAQAMKYNKIGCNLNNGAACHNVGVSYANGEGVKQNLSTAKQYFGKACDLGEQGSCENYKYLNGFGVR